MNSIVEPIFNIFKCVNNACTAHKQWILSLKVNNYSFKKKKKERERENVRLKTQTPNPN